MFSRPRIFQQENKMHAFEKQSKSCFLVVNVVNLLVGFSLPTWPDSSTLLPTTATVSLTFTGALPELWYLPYTLFINDMVRPW